MPHRFGLLGLATGLSPQAKTKSLRVRVRRSTLQKTAPQGWWLMMKSDFNWSLRKTALAGLRTIPGFPWFSSLAAVYLVTVVHTRIASKLNLSPRFEPTLEALRKSAYQQPQGGEKHPACAPPRNPPASLHGNHGRKLVHCGALEGYLDLKPGSNLPFQKLFGVRAIVKKD